MHNYRPKKWLRIVFEFRKADTIYKLFPLMLLMSGYTAAMVFLIHDYWKVPETSPIKQFTQLHTLIGFVISMLLVFRTNTAYDRWWEGRRQWGQLINSSRNFAIKINAFLPLNDHKNRQFFKKLLPLFPEALYRHLRSETTLLELDDEPHPEIPGFDHTKHVPNQVASMLAFKLNLLVSEGILSPEQFIIINPELQSFLDVCGACERIRNTPIPYSYSAFIKKFMFIYLITLPLGLAFVLQYILVPIVAIIFYVLASLEIIAEEIEDPFGNDPNDLPLERMANTIKTNVLDLIR
ncbi:MAG: hypothetical protein EBZ77_02475 [Chitinophagia bacterium]|nr:hypothetical protein [Chitinophagia bacterium]